MRDMRAAMIGGAAMLAVAATPAQGPSFVAFAKVERGMWQLREIGGPTRAMCIADPATLFQLRSTKMTNCSRFVVENAPTTATVSYDCPGAGQGRTTIAVETPRLMRIDSQGFDNGQPFAVEIEARRTGACAGDSPR
jgi:hypothetical protein